MRSPDITDRLENLRENLNPEAVRKVAAFRAGVWTQHAAKHEEKLPELAAYCRETARWWAEVAGE